MLTRLKVNGFKNLVDIDVRFGPFTCIAGVNGSGKSNLFDAIRFLSALAEKPLVEAALSIVRGSGGRSADIRSLFHRVGDGPAKEMSFEAEMIIPAEGVDDLGQPIKAGSTFLCYCLTLGYRGDRLAQLPLEIKRETLRTIGSEAMDEHLRFPCGAGWQESAVRGDARKGRVLLSVPGPVRASGSPAQLVSSLLPRTVLSTASAVHQVDGEGMSIRIDPVTLARQEMRSWEILHLDPSAMRAPDDATTPTTIGSNGAHVARTLYEIAHQPPADGRDPYEAETAVYARVAGRIWRLVGDVWDLTVERDDKREEFTLYVTDRNGTRYSARELSDGTLRMLALAVIEEEQKPGLLCIEEPENGIHPRRIPELLGVLQAIAMDTTYPIEEGNPLRQVIISTHSPSVVMQVPGDSLVLAELRDTVREGKRFKRAHFSGLADTWRDPVRSMKSLPLGALLDFLVPEGYRPLPRPDPERNPEDETRVMDRADVRRMLSPHPPD